MVSIFDLNGIVIPPHGTVLTEGEVWLSRIGGIVGSVSCAELMSKYKMYCFSLHVTYTILL